jgi:hypothetical protein
MANPDPYTDPRMTGGESSPADSTNKWSYGAALGVFIAIGVIVAALSYRANERSLTAGGPNSTTSSTVGRGMGGMAPPPGAGAHAPAAPSTPAR